MPDYSKTIIYKIQHEENEELVYIGSTTDFTKRKYHHKSSSNNPNGKEYNYKLYKMINENGGWACFNMIQIKEFPCNNRREAEAEEDAVMLELKANMNSRRASRTPKEYYEEHKEKIQEYKKEYYEDNPKYMKDYYEKNKEKISQQMKDYYEDNKEKISQYKKEYREENKERLSQQWKDYYNENKERLSQQWKEKITCECGCIINKGNLAKHKKTTKHIELINETKTQ